MRPARGFTLLEVGVAAALFAAALGVVAVATARAQYAAATARNAAQTAQEVEFLLEEVAARGAAQLAAGVSSPPQPCVDDASRSCLVVQGRQVRLSWTVRPGLLWRTSAADGDASSLLLTVDATSELGFSLQRSVRVPSAPAGSLLRLVPQGERYDGPVFLAEADGTLLTSPSGEPVGAVVADGAQVLLEVPAGSCLTAGACFLALTPDGATVAGDLALTPASVRSTVQVSQGRVSEHPFRLARLRPLTLQLEAVDAEGVRTAPAQVGSVCLWLLQPSDAGDVPAGGACNSVDPALVEFFALTPDLARPHAQAAFPSGEPVKLATSLPDGSCPPLPGALLPRSGSWLPVDPTGAAACTDFVWGAPTLFRSSAADPGVAFAQALLQVESGEELPFPVVSWSALEPAPLAASQPLPAAGTVGSVRVARSWSLPSECAEAADCSSSAAPVASSFVSGAFLELPVAGAFGLPSQPLPAGSEVELDLTVTAPSATAVTVTLSQLPDDLQVEVYDDTELLAWQAEPAPTGPEPDPWQPVGAGEELPPGPYASGSQLRLRLSAAAAFAGGRLLLRLDDGRQVDEPLWLTSGPPGVAAARLPFLRLFQAVPARFPVHVVGWDGEVWQPGSLPAAAGVPAGATVVLEESDGLLWASASALSAPAGVSAVTFALPGYTASGRMTVLSSPAPLAFSAAAAAALSSPLLQGGSLQLALSAQDMASDPLQGWPLWVGVEDASALPARGLGAEELSCVTSAAGSCVLTVAAAATAAPGGYALRLAAGGSSSRNVSEPLSFQLDPNVTGLLVEGVTGSPGTTVSAAATVADASGRPVAGVTLTVSGLPDGVTAVLSGPSSASGLVVLDLTLPLTLPAGSYSYTVALPSGATSSASLQVSPLAVAVLASTPVQVGAGGTASVSLQVTLPSGAPASARALQAVSPQDGLLADVVSVTDGSGQALLSFSAAAPFPLPLPSAVLTVELFSAGQKVGEVPVQVLPGLAAVDVFGAVAAGSSSQLTLTLTDASAAPLASRQVLLSFPDTSALGLAAVSSPCLVDPALICTDASGRLTVTVEVSPAAVSGLLGVSVDGVRLDVPLEVVG